MRFYLLDTGSASDFVNRRGAVRARALRRHALGDRIGICTPVLGELLGGIEFSTTRPRNRARLLHDLPRWTVWPYERPAAEEYGRIYAHLRTVGRPMQQVDMQIAAVALTLRNCTVVTKDSDFQAIPGLDVEDWSS